jgi:hypothetical protein
MLTYKIIALAAIDEAVHDCDDLEPQIEQFLATHVSQQDQVV